MKRIALFFSLASLWACGDKLQQFNDISYRSDKLECSAENNTYWLMEIKATTANDSVIFDSKQIGRKLEVHTDQMNKNSSFYQLMAQVCKGDSIYMEMEADSFYTSLNGQRPDEVAAGKLKLNITLYDQLNDLEYLAHKQLFEKQSIKKYVEKFRWNAVHDSATGVYYEKLKVARDGSSHIRKAKLSYVIKTIDDNLVDRSTADKPLEFDVDDPGLLRGLRFVGSLLKDQESIRAIIPSTMAFGSRGFERVPPNQPIIVEMEVLEVIE